MSSRALAGTLVAIAFLLPVAASADTTSDLQSQLIALLQQLVTVLQAELQQIEASLQLQNNQLPANPPAQMTMQAACFVNGATLQSGASQTFYSQSTVSFGQTCSSQVRTCTNGILSGSYQYAVCSSAAAALSCTPLSAQTQTTACPTGQTGSITQIRTSNCPTGATTPVWSGWTQTANTCAPPSSVGGSCVYGLQSYANGTTLSFPSAACATSSSAQAMCPNVPQTCQSGTWVLTSQTNSGSSCLVSTGASYPDGSTVGFNPCPNVGGACGAAANIYLTCHAGQWFYYNGTPYSSINGQLPTP